MTKNEKVKLLKEDSEKCYVPARYVLTFLFFWGMSLEYAHRVCLSVTIVAMVNHTAPADPPPNGTLPDDVCSKSPSGNSSTTGLEDDGEYAWSPSVQGVVLGAYFYGYICTHLLGGRMSEMVGGKWPMGLSILGGSLLTLATPVVADIGFVALVVLRFSMGLMHGVCLPTAFAMYSRWAAADERNTLVAVCFVGDHVGTIVTMPLAAYLCQFGFAGGWPSVYYVLGLLGCGWFVFWAALVHSRPSEHPRISKRELRHIRRDQEDQVDKDDVPVPWVSVLSSGAVWSLAAANFCSSWGYNTILTKLPTYLETVLWVPIQKNGFVNSLIYVACSATLLLSGFMSDHLRIRKRLSSTVVRKSFEAFAMLGPGLCTALIPTVGCDRRAVVALLTLTMGFIGFSGGGKASIVSEMAPQHAATLFGLVNGIGSISGVFSPLVAGLVLEGGYPTVDKWSVVFYVSAALNVLGFAIFLAFGSAERQPWAVTPSPSRSQPLLLPTEQAHILGDPQKTKPVLGYGSLTP